MSKRAKDGEYIERRPRGAGLGFQERGNDASPVSIRMQPSARKIHGPGSDPVRSLWASPGKTDTLEWGR